MTTEPPPTPVPGREPQRHLYTYDAQGRCVPVAEGVEPPFEPSTTLGYVPRRCGNCDQPIMPDHGFWQHQELETTARGRKVWRSIGRTCERGLGEARA